MIVLLATVAALGAALVYLTQATEYYKSTSRIYVEQSGPRIITQQQAAKCLNTKNPVIVHVRSGGDKSERALYSVSIYDLISGMKALNSIYK